jgi:protease-4
MKQDFKSALKLIGKLWVIVTAVIGSFAVLAIVGIIVLVSKADTDQLAQTPLSQKLIKQGSGGKIAILRLEGQISESEETGAFAAGSISSTRVTKLLDRLADDPEVKAVVLRINSPGGAVVASDEIYRRVAELQKKKVVVASLGDVAASGGYYIAAGANQIVANPATITGSIGVIAQFPKLSGLYDKVGLEMRTFKSGEFKDLGSESRDFTPEEREIVNGIITSSYDQFVSVIAEGREMDEAKVRELADGRIYSGTQAKDLGLVDEVGDFGTAVNSASKLANVNDPTLIEYSDQSFIEVLFESQSKKLDLTAGLREFVPQSQFGMFYLWTP